MANFEGAEILGSVFSRSWTINKINENFFEAFTENRFFQKISFIPKYSPAIIGKTGYVISKTRYSWTPSKKSQTQAVYGKL